MSENTKKFWIDPSKLQIKDSIKTDAGRGIVRMDPNITQELNLKTSDVLQIKSLRLNKKTAALLYPGRREDQGTGIIRMDQTLRRNLNASLNDFVEIRKIETNPCASLTFAGLKEAVILKNEQQLAEKLKNRIVTLEDLISFYSYGRRIDLVVVDFTPKSEAVRIHPDTKIILADKSFLELAGITKREAAFDAIVLGDKILDKYPEKAKNYYKDALKIYDCEGIGDINWRLGLAYTFLGIKKEDIRFLFKAEKYYRKAILYYKTQQLTIEKNLFELDRLEGKIPPYEKTTPKKFTLPTSFYND